MPLTMSAAVQEYALFRVPKLRLVARGTVRARAVAALRVRAMKIILHDGAAVEAKGARGWFAWQHDWPGFPQGARRASGRI